MLHGLKARLRSLWRGIRQREQVDAEIDDEFQHHLELRAADLVRAGLSPDEAARHARHEFGMTEVHAQKARDARGLRGIDRVRFSWLDVKLGFRMLVRYPGLTIVGGFAIAFAIWVGASAFEFISQVVNPRVPLRGGDRVVALRLWNAETSREEYRTSWDFAVWQRELRTIGDFGAYRVARRNLTVADGYGEPMDIAMISASAFRFAPDPPVLGRALVDADEQEGAPPVVVLGFDLWQTRFGGDSALVGRTVRLGGVATTVVGVMPRGFRFPVANQAWVPLRHGANAQPLTGPSIRVFGRLAPGVGLDEAQLELAASGARLAVDHPLTHVNLRAQVMPFAKSMLNLETLESALLLSVNLFLALLLVLVCGNVALLMFARAAAREPEIVVRSALGAGRGRLVGQFLAEALVLGGLAAVVGLVATRAGLRWWIGVIENMEGPLPFWFTSSIGPSTIAYVVGLTLLSAAIMGTLPALKVTRRLADRLRATGAGGGGPSIGGIWTVLIVGQIALTVAFPVMTYFIQRDVRQISSLDVGFADHEYLAARLVMDSPDGDSAAALRLRYAKAMERVKDLLAGEPLVSGLTFADRLPRMYHQYRLVELDEGGAAPLNPDWPAYRVSSAHVDRDFFTVVGAPVLQGRGFHSGDLVDGSRAVIVNESFVKLVLGGRNPIGRHVRYVRFEGQDALLPEHERGPWYEIVGVVEDLGFAPYQAHDPKYAGFYHATYAAGVMPAWLAIHVKGDPAAFGPRLRGLVERADPALGVQEALPLSAMQDRNLRFYDFWMQLTTIVCGMALLLSLAGIYSVTSFTVARRTREIGVRVALGADRRRLVMTIFRRPLRQVGLGVLAGTALVTLLIWMVFRDRMTLTHLGLVALYATFMLSVCLVASAVPMRRALAVEPTEALRAE